MSEQHALNVCANQITAGKLTEQYEHITTTDEDAVVSLEGPFAYCDEFLGSVWRLHQGRYRAPLKPDAHCQLVSSGLTKTKGRNVYQGTSEQTEKALHALGLGTNLPAEFRGRRIEVQLTRQREIFLKVPRHKDDARPTTGLWASFDKHWELLVGQIKYQPERDIVSDDLEQFVRVCEEGGTSQHFIKTDGASAGHWSRVNTGSVLRVLQHKFNIRRSEAEPLLGSLEGNPWKIVNRPFQTEYPGGRVWNKTDIQLSVVPEECEDWQQACPTWFRVLSHCGKDLDNDAPRHGFKDGADYLQAIFASILREPEQPTPYLFLFGPENSGKSILHEAFELLVTGGCVKADRALTSSANFNGELALAILGIVEETDLSKSSGALNKIKDYVTSRKISIRKMRTDSYMAVNMTHWIQTANSPDYCPIIDGDTRITAIEVKPPDTDIPKGQLLQKLEEEAPKFVYSLVNRELPPATGRLRIPVIKTATAARIVDRGRPDWVHGLVEMMRDREFWSGSANDLSTLLSSEKIAFDAPVTARKLRSGLLVHQSFLDRNFIAFEIEGTGNRTRTLVLRKLI